MKHVDYIITAREELHVYKVMRYINLITNSGFYYNFSSECFTKINENVTELY